MGYMPNPHGGWGQPLPPAKTFPDKLILSPDVRPLVSMINELPHGVTMAMDTETTGLDMHQRDRIRGISIAFYKPRTFGPVGYDLVSFYIPVGYERNPLAESQVKEICEAISKRDPFLILHHGKFDFAFLRQLPYATDGRVYFPIPEPNRWWDTKVVAWLLDENLPTGLKEQAAFHFGEDARDEQKAIQKLVKERGGWQMLTPQDTYLYACKDAELTYRLYQLQIGMVHGMPPNLGDIRPAIERELLVQAVLMRLEATGILVDEVLLDELTARTSKRIAEIEETFAFNLKSPRQVAKWLDEAGALPANYPRTKSGQPSMTRAALEKLDEMADTDHSGLKLILEHRRLQKAMSGYLVPLKARIGRDGRVHAGFMSTGTVTGRFSCSRPNLQTIPRGDTLPGVRDLFVAEDGFELWEYDLSAAEMRVIAGMADETGLMEALTSGADMHGRLALQVFGPKYTGLQRRYAKNIGYGWFYGLTSVKTAAKYIAGKDGEKIAGQILEGLKKLYPRIYKLMGKTTRVAQKEGYVRIHDFAWPGRFRRFVTQGPRRPAPYTALNAKVQGGIGELMKDVMIVAEPILWDGGARICLQVHDSLVIEVPEGCGEKVKEELQRILDDVNPFEMRMLFDAHEWSEHE